MWSQRIGISRPEDWRLHAHGVIYWEKISWKKYPARLDFKTNFRYELENNAFL